jgi:ribose transport system permease protein
MAAHTDSRPTATSLRRLFGSPDRRSLVFAYGTAALLFIIATISSSGFASSSNVAAVLTTASFIGIAAIGQTFVILGGGIDLSVPWVITFTAIAVSRLTNGSDSDLPWAMLVILGGALVLGLVNGIGVAYLRINPIIMTLGAGGVLQGLLLLYTGGTGSPDAPAFLGDLSGVTHGFIRWSVIIWIVLAVLATIVLSRTSFGRQLYAVGASATVARFSGIAAERVTVATYIVSAVSAAIAALLIVGNTGQAFLSIGNPYLFSTIAAVAVGGTSILGGRGSYLGTVAGALTLTILTSLLQILNLGTGYLPIVYGGVILLAVVLATGRFREASA